MLRDGAARAAVLHIFRVLCATMGPCRRSSARADSLRRLCGDGQRIRRLEVRRGARRLARLRAALVFTTFGTQLLTRAAERGLECTVLRLGQTCGPRTTGAWAPAEWVPILVKSSLALGALPDLDGVCISHFS